MMLLRIIFLFFILFLVCLGDACRLGFIINGDGPTNITNDYIFPFAHANANANANDAITTKTLKRLHKQNKNTNTNTSGATSSRH